MLPLIQRLKLTALVHLSRLTDERLEFGVLGVLKVGVFLRDPADLGVVLLLIMAVVLCGVVVPARAVFIDSTDLIVGVEGPITDSGLRGVL